MDGGQIQLGTFDENNGEYRWFIYRGDGSNLYFCPIGVSNAYAYFKQCGISVGGNAYVGTLYVNGAIHTSNGKSGYKTIQANDSGLLYWEDEGFLRNPDVDDGGNASPVDDQGNPLNDFCLNNIHQTGFSDALDKVMALSWVSFSWNEEGLFRFARSLFENLKKEEIPSFLKSLENTADFQQLDRLLEIEQKPIGQIIGLLQRVRLNEPLSEPTLF